MTSKTICAVLLLAFAASTAWASSVTVLGQVGGRVWFDNRDYGPPPVRITRVTPGTHTIRVQAANGQEKTFTLQFAAGQESNPVIDLDRELGLSSAWRDDDGRDRRDRRRARRYDRYGHDAYSDPYYGSRYGGYPYGGYYGGYPYGYGYPGGGFYGGPGIGFGTTFGGGRRRGFGGGSGLFFGLGGFGF